MIDPENACKTLLLNPEPGPEGDVDLSEELRSAALGRLVRELLREVAAHRHGEALAQNVLEHLSHLGSYDHLVYIYIYIIKI